MFIRYEIFPKDVKIHHEDFTLSQKEYCIFMKPVSMSMWFLQRPITSKSMSPLNDINYVNVVMEVYECADCTNRNEQRSKSKPVQQMATAMLYRAAAVQRIVLARCRFGDLNPTRCHFRYRPTHAHAHTHVHDAFDTAVLSFAVDDAGSWGSRSRGCGGVRSNKEPPAT